MGQCCSQGHQTADSSGAAKQAADGRHSRSMGPTPSYAALRGQMLSVASWALAATGWAYIVVPRFTLHAMFGDSGKLWTLTPNVHLAHWRLALGWADVHGELIRPTLQCVHRCLDGILNHSDARSPQHALQCRRPTFHNSTKA